MPFLSQVLQLYVPLLWLPRTPQFLTYSSDKALPRNTRLQDPIWTDLHPLTKEEVHLQGSQEGPSQVMGEEDRTKQKNERKAKDWSIPLFCDTLILESEQALVGNADCLKHIPDLLLFG